MDNTTTTLPPPAAQYRVPRALCMLVKKWVLVPIVATLISAMLIGRITNALLGTNTYKIYFVGPLDSTTAQRSAAQQMKDGFVVSNGPALHLGGAQIEFDPVDDRGDPATALRIADDLANRPDTLLVVGHTLSTQTKQALPIYLQHANPPIPVILTTETNPDLLPPKISNETYYPVFRLSPTDEAQAESAVQFARSKGANAFWVIEDRTNPVYANFLARKFIEQAQANGIKVMLLSTNLTVPPVDMLQRLRVDWVFFAGDWPNALILIRQLKALQLHLHVILSDGCMDQQLITQGGHDVDGIYLTHPLTAETYRESGYTVYGHDARVLVTQLIEHANHNYAALAAEQGGIA